MRADVLCDPASQSARIQASVLARMSTTAYGRILVWEGASLWILSAPPGQRYPKTAAHAHHALQLTVALTGRVDFDLESGCLGGDAVAIAPDVPHAFEGTGLVAHVFLDPDCEAGRRVARVLCADRAVAPIPPQLLADFPARLRTAFDDPRHTDGALKALAVALIARLAGQGIGAPVLDPRIEQAMAFASGRLDRAVSLRDLSALVGLSPGRTRHLFVEQTGLSLRTYLLWLRLGRAVESFAGGASLTHAAHAAGFADSAHFSRTFRRMFGISAGSLRVS